jgi:hypothetical protein
MGKVNIFRLIQKDLITGFLTMESDLIESDLDLGEVTIPESYLTGLDTKNILYVEIIIRFIHNYYFKYPKRKRIINKLLNETEI